MAEVQVKNSVTGALGPIAAQRSRYEKAETAFGHIPSDAYAIGDTLSFDDVPMKELIHARFVAGGTTSLDIFNGADLESPIDWDILQTLGVTGDIDYVITYIRGTGRVKTSQDLQGEGDLIQLTITPPDPDVVSVAATPVGQTTATVKGTVDPNGAVGTVVFFEYGTAAGVYGAPVAAAQSPLAYATTAQNVSLGLTGLTAATQYYYRVGATNTSGTFYGSELSFTTTA